MDGLKKNRVLSVAELYELIREVYGKPSAADLDAVATEQRIKEQTSGNQH